MISRFFIDRPIFTAVLMMVIMLAGLAAIRVLPVAQFPEIAPPMIMVTATYPGASADVVSRTVAAPIEQQLTGVEKMLYLSTSCSANGTASLTLTFETGTDVDKAAIDVRNRISLAEPALPQEVRRGGVTVSKISGSMLLIVALQSPDGRYDDVAISNFASLNVLDALKRLPGAGSVQIMGAKDYAMRVWIMPDVMAQHDITAGDIARAIQEQNSMYAVGRIGQEPVSARQELTIPVTTRGRLSEPAEFERIIVKAHADGSIIRLKDVARVELGTTDYEFVGRLNGAPTTLMAVNLQSGANALNLARAVRATMGELSKNFPAGITYSLPYDTTRFVEVSIEEVIHTLFAAIVLVFLVVFLFLQNWRATLIPTLAVPVSLIGTFAGMYLLGYSINTLTLFGLVLAIGIVVDDAIVVVENVERIMHDEGLPPRTATLKAMEEVTGPVIAIVLVLCAVFIPVTFIGGMAGQLYKQFAVTIAVSVIVSGITALTLSPVLAALLLKPRRGAPAFFLFRWFNRFFEQAGKGYVWGAALVIRRSGLFACLFLLLVASAYGLFRAVPRGFLPPEDQGYIMAVAMLPDSSTIRRTLSVTEGIEKIFRAHPAVENVVSFSGFDLLGGGTKPGAAAYFVTLKDWKVRRSRPLQAAGVIGSVMPQLLAIQEAQVFAFNPPSIPGLGARGGFEFNLQNRGEGDAAAMARIAGEFMVEAGKRREIQGMNTTFRANVPQIFVDLDRDKAKVLGVPLREVFDTMQSLVGTLYVNDFNKSGRVFKVELQAEPRYRASPQDIGRLFVRSADGKTMPLNALLTVSNTAGPELVTRFNGFLSASISGSAAPGYSTGQAITAMEEVAARVLPAGMGYEWSGEAYQQKKTGGQSLMVLVMGIVMVFLILAAQYERLALPFSVLLAIPFGLLGALAAIWLKGMENDIYFQIGLVTLIGLAVKNAILIVEFAAMKHAEGLMASEAAIEAARLRFRPILMTSLAFILGVTPLAMSSGAGAASRHSIGVGVMGGMVAATFLAIFFVPLFYTLVQRVNGRGRKNREEGVPPLPLILLSLALPLLSSCTALGPDYRRPAVAVPSNWQIPPEEARAIANQQWWRYFGDARLEELVEKALEENRDVKIAAASLAEFRALLGIARSERYPQIDVSISAGRSRTFQTGDPPAPPDPLANQFSGSFNLSYELDLWGRIRRSEEAARADLLAREEFKRFVLIELAAQVASTYLELAELDKRLAIAGNALVSRQKALELAEVRFQGGVTSELDVRQAEGETAAAATLIPQLEQQLQIKEHLLNVLLGRNPGVIERGQGLDALSSPLIPAGLPSDILVRRPDIVQAEQELVAANARIGEARAAYFPRISLTGLMGTTSDALQSLFAGPARTWSAAAGAAAPLFNAGRTARQVEAAEARRQQALFRYEKTVLTAFREVADSLTTHGKAREQREAQERQVSALKEAHRLANLRYMNGYTNYLDVLDAQRNLLNAELALVQLQGAILLSMVDMYRAFGGGW